MKHNTIIYPSIFCSFGCVNMLFYMPICVQTTHLNVLFIFFSVFSFLTAFFLGYSLTFVTLGALLPKLTLII